jgi:hypothetical protein
MITPQQQAFFNTFGYLHVPGGMRADYPWISDDYEAVWREHAEITHAGDRTTTYPGLFISARPRLSTLLDHPVITDIADTLLGVGWALNGGDGNRYSGDTGWHSDCGAEHWEVKTTVRHLKIAFYLDPLTADTGALRVVPGSHHFGDRYWDLLDKGLCTDAQSLRLPGPQVPAVALAVTPGDLVCFDHRLKHASFGGSKRRRMFTMNLNGPIHDARDKEAVLTVMRFYRDQQQVDYQVRKGWLDWIETLTPAQRRRVQETADLGAEVMQEKAAALR